MLEYDVKKKEEIASRIKELKDKIKRHKEEVEGNIKNKTINNQPYFISINV